MKTTTERSTETSTHVLPLSGARSTTLALTGGKGANLARLITAGLPVPDGFCVTTTTFEALLDDDIRRLIDDLEAIDPADLEAQQKLAAELRDRIREVGLPEPTIGAISELIEPGERYVVRSSATAEDLPWASFAGQHETVLDVEGVEAVAGAVRTCIASLFTDRAVSYRARNGIPHADVAMAVVVQRMVDATASGVLFTADPESGKRTVAVIDAAPGLGEAVVSGTLTADHVRVDRETGEILEYVTGTYAREGDGAEGATRVLSQERIATLVGYGEAIERSFGGPQDIEWSIADGQMWILQTRPITTLFPIPEPEPADDGLHVYYSWNHRQGMTEPLPPLVVDYWLETMKSVFDLLGFHPTGSPVGAAAGGMVYIDVTAFLRSDRVANGLLNGLEDFDRQAIPLLEEVRAERGDELAPVSLLRGTSPTQTLRTAGRMTPVLGQTLGSIVRGLVTSAYRKAPERSREWADRYAGTMIREIQEGDTVAERLRLAIDKNRESIWGMVRQALMLWNIYVYRAALRRLCPDTEAELEAIERGLRENVTTAMMLELGDVADVARDLPAVREALREDRTLGEIREVEGGTEFSAAFEGFLERYGFRAATEIEFSQPRYYEDPSPLLSTIRASIEAGEPGAHRKQIERLEAEAEKAISKMEEVASQQRPVAGRQRLVRPFALRYRSFLTLREITKYSLSQMLTEVRRQVLEAAEVLVREGAIEEADDVWFFTFDELIEALESPGAPVDVDLDRRRAEHERHLQLRAPRVIASDGEIPRVAAAPVADGEGMVGIATAGGVAEGIARVIHNPGQARLEAGEILVAPHTDPGWTPLFLNAAGLVTNVGGKMTHGSIVAREYGIPSVVLPDATQRISTGQRIRVDGDRGVVEERDR